MLLHNVLFRSRSYLPPSPCVPSWFRPNRPPSLRSACGVPVVPPSLAFACCPRAKASAPLPALRTASGRLRLPTAVLRSGRSAPANALTWTVGMITCSLSNPPGGRLFQAPALRLGASPGCPASATLRPGLLGRRYPPPVYPYTECPFPPEKQA